jgi:hypothetical protein
MATAKRTRRNKHYWEHEYTITKIDPTLRRIEVITVVGSKEATTKQEQIEDQGYFAVVFNVTTNEEEYRTPGCEK